MLDVDVKVEGQKTHVTLGIRIQHQLDIGFHLAVRGLYDDGRKHMHVCNVYIWAAGPEALVCAANYAHVTKVARGPKPH